MNVIPKTVNDLLDYWPGNIPFKGRLISDDGSCMSAQGQALHFLGGMSAEELRRIEETEADMRVAELFGVSRAHAVLLRIVNDSQPGAPTCVIREPKKVLGDQAQTVLAFWRHLDSMTGQQWVAARDAARDAAWVAAWDAARDAARDAAGDAARDAAGDAARDAAGDAARDAAWVAAWDAARDAAWVAARDAARDAAWVAARDASWVAARASNEIQGAAIMRERGQPFFFLPMFGFANPEAVLTADKEHSK